jgi:hypothetical protein
MSPQNRKILTRLSEHFQVNNGYFLDKALVLLGQFKSGSVFKNRKRIKSEDIKGLKSEDIHFIMMSLNDTFRHPVIQKVDTYLIPNIDNSDPAKIGMDFVYEGTEYLETAAAFLEFIKAGQDKKLTHKDGHFFYLSEQLDVRKGNLHNLLKAIFSITHGNNQIIEYKELYNELRRNDIYRHKTDDQLKQFVQKYLTSKGYHFNFDTKVQKKFKGAEMLFETVEAVGIKFLNQK